MAQENTKEVKETINISMFLIFMFIILLIWWLAGFVGFLMSIICCFYNGSTTDKFLGILMAWVLGPFYWLYFIYNSSYCARFNKPQIQQSYYE
jgi:hypothetical protein